nr:glycoside hydrolase family 6 protein [Catellatospora tritici]
MNRSVHNLRRRLLSLLGVGALVGAFVATAGTPAQAAVACQVTYTKAWDNGSGFGANLTINNTGDAWTSWTLTFTWPGNQTGIQGWSANYSQSGKNVTATSLSYNGAVATGGSVGIGFNASYSGTNTNPTSFAVNGVTCNGGGTGNTPPSVALTSPTPGQTFASGAAVPLAATATDNSGVARVEFRVDGNLVGTDTSSPYSFSATGLANGGHSATATAVDNGNPALSTTSAAVTFTVGGGTGNPVLQVSAGSLVVNEGGTGTLTYKLSAAPSGNVAVTLSKSGDADVTISASSLTLTTANWSSGVTVTVSAAEDTDTTNGTATVSATSAAGNTSTTVTESDNDGGGCQPNCNRVDNPYQGAGVYNNPQWRASAMAEPGGSRIANQPTGVWLDQIGAIAGNGSPTTGTMGLVDHLNEAVSQDAANGSAPMVIQIVIYDLPGRDCAALASNGELGPNDLPRYKSEYIDAIAAIMARPAYASLRIVTIVEIDSLPNLVTNTNGRATATAMCDTMLANHGYVDGVGYALAKLGAIPNVYNYIDAAHHGWIGWDDNFGATATIMFQAATASGSTVANVHGFITDTANYSALTEPYVGAVTEQLRQTRWIDWNRYNEELAFAQAFRQRLIQAGFQSGIGMLIDTSRNGWGSCVVTPCQPIQTTRPTAASSSTDLNTFVDQSRIDRRIHKGNWCNQAGAGLGERPRSAPATGIDAYVWIKPPGESDGSSSQIPNSEGKGFDRMCDPTYTGNARNGNSMTGALPNAPLSGHWFSAQFRQLMANAYPPLS